jgi:hypothetical protein
MSCSADLGLGRVKINEAMEAATSSCASISRSTSIGSPDSARSDPPAAFEEACTGDSLLDKVVSLLDDDDTYEGDDVMDNSIPAPPGLSQPPCSRGPQLLATNPSALAQSLPPWGGGIAGVSFHLQRVSRGFAAACTRPGPPPPPTQWAPTILPTKAVPPPPSLSSANALAPPMPPPQEEAPKIWPQKVEVPPPPAVPATLTTFMESTSLPRTPKVTFASDASADCPTIGSASHYSGDCKPCAFFYTKGCQNARNCSFCHLCDAGEKKRRLKEKKQQVRVIKAVESLL